jgi:hypothetical protein
MNYSDAATIHLTLNLQVQDKQNTSFSYNFDGATPTGTFTDSKIFDSNHEYDLAGCHKSTITVGSLGSADAKLDLWTQDTGTNKCTEIKYSAKVDNTDAGKTAFVRSSADTITMQPEEDHVAVILKVNTNNSKEFKVTGVKDTGLVGNVCDELGPLESCHDISDVTLTLQDKKHGSVTIKSYTKSSDPLHNPTITKTFSVIIADSSADGAAAQGANTPGSGSKDLGCDASFSNPLTWIICPVIDILDGTIEVVDGWITDELTIPPNEIFCTNNDVCGAYHAAWSSFRDIALGLMAIAGLVIVIAEALGLEILDAYTIRKTLPRLLVAAIAITLSWPLMKFAVTLSNDLGAGVKYLIDAPFSSLGGKVHLDFSQSPFGHIGSFFFGGAAFAAAIASAVIFIGIILSLVGTAALAVFVAILVLVLRQIAVILLILIAPIAIVFYILPNTSRFYKLWWESFIKALLMFPLIIGFIAAGRAFSFVSLANPDNPLLNQIIGFLAYFAPYFMIPITFKLAGGAMSSIGGFVNQRAQGGFQGLRQNRANQVKKKLAAGRQRALGARVFKNAPLNSRREKVNSAIQSAALLGQAGKNPLRMADRIRAAKGTANFSNALQGLENSKAFAMLKGDDEASHAILHGRGTRADRMAWLRAKGFDEETAKQKNAHIENVLAAAEQEGLSPQSIRQAAVLSAVQASTSYDTDPVTGERGVGKLLSDIDMASGGDEQTRAQMVGRVKQLASQAGRGDLSAPFSDEFKTSRNIAMQAINSTAPNSEARRDAIQQANAALTDKIIDVEGPGFVLGGKGRMVEELMPALQRRIQRAAQNVEAANLSETGTVDITDGEGNVRTLTADDANREMREVLASTAGLHDLVSQISPEKGRLLASGLLTHNIPGFATTVEQEIDSFQMDPEFVRMRGAYERNLARQAGGNTGGMDPAEAARLQQLAGGQPPIPPVEGSTPG